MISTAASPPWSIFTGNPAVVVQDLFISRYLSVAGFVILLYDTLLLLPAEISFLKKSQASFKWIFILNKYITIISLIFIILATSGLSNLTLSNKFYSVSSVTLHSCKGSLSVATLLGSPSIAIVSAMAVLRITALSNLRRHFFWLCIVTVLIFLAALGTVIFTLIKVVGTIQFIPGFAGIGGICIVGGNTRDVAVSVVLPLALDISVLAVTLQHALSKPQHHWRLRLETLVYNGFAHFLVIFVCRLACLLIIAIGPPTLLLAGVIFAWPFISAVLSRLVVTLRNHGQRQQRGHHSHHSLTHNHSGHAAAEFTSEEDLEMEVNPGPRSFETDDDGIKEIPYETNYGGEQRYNGYQGYDDFNDDGKTNTESDTTPRIAYTIMEREGTDRKETNGGAGRLAVEVPSATLELQPLSFADASGVYR